MAEISSLGLFNKLHEDVIICILAKLPAKDLLQLTRVSKLFKFLISKPDFLKIHLSSIATLNPLHYFQLCRNCGPNYEYRFSIQDSRDFCSYKFLEVPFEGYNYAERLTFVGSTRGVVCFSKEVDTFAANTITLFLWNPCIVKLEHVPPVVTVGNRHCKTLNVFGLGFDCVSVDFKVVAITDCSREEREFGPKASVYSQNTKSWRRVGHVVPCFIGNSDANAIVNGVVYWLANKKWDYSIKQPDCIMGFDVVNEVFMVVELPQNVLYPSLVLRLCSLSDEKSLSIFVSDFSWYLSSSWRVFMMNVCGGKVKSWEEKYEIELQNAFIPRTMANVGEILCTNWSAGYVLNLLIDLETKLVMEIKNYELPGALECITCYTPSLALVDIKPPKVEHCTN